jgi:hypothetical protein
MMSLMNLFRLLICMPLPRTRPHASDQNPTPDRTVQDLERSGYANDKTATVSPTHELVQYTGHDEVFFRAEAICLMP